MKKFLAMAVYRCLVGGLPSGSLDVQVQYHLAESADDVRARVGAQVRNSYENADGEHVAWELREIMAVEELGRVESGDELIGFIAEVAEFGRLA